MQTDKNGSHNHAMVLANLAYLLKQGTSSSVATRLSLDSSQLDKTVYNVDDELIPDICLYPKRGLSLPLDILKMEEMPLLIVEVLSPRQFMASLLEKFQAYFALGIRSCWLVDPTTHTVHVYPDMKTWESFTMGETLHDQVLDIQLAVAEIFD